MGDKRIPLHRHEDNNSGGLIARSTVVTQQLTSGGSSGSAPLASEVPVIDSAGNFAASDVENVLAEIAGDITADFSAHDAAADPHPGYVLESLIDAAGDLIVGTADNTVGRLAKGADSTVLTVDPTTHLPIWATAPGASGGDTTGQLVAIFDGGGAAPSAGATCDVAAPFTGTITDWEMLGDVSGSAVVKVGKDVAANFPPTFPTDLITASAPPTLTSASRAASSTLTGWTTAVTAGDILRFEVVSASTLGRVTCVLNYSRP